MLELTFDRCFAKDTPLRQTGPESGRERRVVLEAYTIATPKSRVQSTNAAEHKVNDFNQARHHRMFNSEVSARRV